ncbi:MAG: hypothetical protein ABFS45_03905 [Pseudomonadota bacterium]
MRRRYRKNRIKLIASGIALVIGIGGLGYAALQVYGKATPDQYGCFNEVPQSQTLVLLDASDPRFNEEQARSLRTYFDGLYDRLAFNERLSIFTSEGDQVASVARPRIHLCGQASTPEQHEAVGAGASQAGYLQKQRQRLYDKILAPELDQLLSAKPVESRRQLYQSPILELIADLSRSAHLKPGSRLIIISDLLQNSDSARFCRVKGHMPRFAVFKKRPVYEGVKPQSLEGVDVEVLMFQRYGYGEGGLRYCRDEEEIRSFWHDYFLDSGVKDPRFIRIRLGITGA